MDQPEAPAMTLVKVQYVAGKGHAARRPTPDTGQQLFYKGVDYEVSEQEAADLCATGKFMRTADIPPPEESDE